MEENPRIITSITIQTLKQEIFHCEVPAKSVQRIEIYDNTCRFRGIQVI